MPPSTTRRGLLAAAGTALLAGCAGLNSTDEPEPISIHRLPDYTDDGEAQPVVAERLPVTIERAELEARADRTTDLLDTLPIPLTANAIPNEHIRKELLHAAEQAGDHLEAARNAPNRFVALQFLRYARVEARYAAAGWAYTEGDASEAAMQEEHQQALDDAESLRSDHEYRGGDPVPAALVHATVERNLSYVTRDSDPDHMESGSLLAVAEWGGHAERAHATVEDTRYLYDRFLDSLASETGTVDDRLATATERITTDLDRRRSNLPPVPTDAYDQPFYRLRDRFRDAVEDGPRQVTDAPGPASSLLTATARLVDGMAYERVMERLESEEGIELEDAEDVRAARETAVAALDTALKKSSRPALVRPVLADAAQLVSYADEELTRYRSNVRPTRLEDPVGQYVAATAKARSAPAACDRVLEALEN